jgi:hypothetical protein
VRTFLAILVAIIFLFVAIYFGLFVLIIAPAQHVFAAIDAHTASAVLIGNTILMVICGLIVIGISLWLMVVVPAFIKVTGGGVNSPLQLFDLGDVTC